jgi:hypothetical protein
MFFVPPIGPHLKYHFGARFWQTNFWASSSPGSCTY